MSVFYTDVYGVSENAGSFRTINLACYNCTFHSSIQEIASPKKPQAPNSQAKPHQCHSRLHLLHSQFKNKSKKPISNNFPWYYHTGVLLVRGQPGLMKMQETGWLFARYLNMVQVHIIDNRWEKHLPESPRRVNSIRLSLFHLKLFKAEVCMLNLSCVTL